MNLDTIRYELNEFEKSKLYRSSSYEKRFRGWLYDLMNEVEKQDRRIQELESILHRIANRPMKCSEINPPRDNWYIGYDQSTIVATSIANKAFEEKE